MMKVYAERGNGNDIVSNNANINRLPADQRRLGNGARVLTPTEARGIRRAQAAYRRRNSGNRQG